MLVFDVQIMVIAGLQTTLQRLETAKTSDGSINTLTQPVEASTEKAG